jgi:hypothetical protein
MQNRRHSSFSGRWQPRHENNSDFSLGEILSEKLSHLKATVYCPGIVEGVHETGRN